MTQLTPQWFSLAFPRLQLSKNIYETTRIYLAGSRSTSANFSDSMNVFIRLPIFYNDDIIPFSYQVFSFIFSLKSSWHLADFATFAELQ